LIGFYSVSGSNVMSNIELSWFKSYKKTSLGKEIQKQM